MAEKQPRWTTYEAAILLDGYLETIKKLSPKMQIIKRVSDDLRRMALNSGIVIDDVYRNTNGISFQMQSMDSAYQGKTIMKPATQLFADIVSLYKDDYAGYEKLLKEARALIDEKHGYKDAFLSWLERTYPAIPANTVIASCNAIEQFCLKLKMLKAPLFDTTDTDALKAVQRTVSRNKIFRITNKKQLKWIDAAMGCILRFVSEGNLETAEKPEMPDQPNSEEESITQQPGSNDNSTEPYVRTEQDRRLLAKYPHIYKRVFTVLRAENQTGTTIAYLYEQIDHIARCAEIEDLLDNVSWSKCVFKRYIFSEEIVSHGNQVEVADGEKLSTTVATQNEIATNVVDFISSGDYTYTKPVSLSYFGDKTVGFSSWTDLYVRLLSVLFDDYPDIIPIRKSFTGSGRVDFGDVNTARTMTAPKSVNAQMYLETNLSAKNIVDKIKALLDICRVDYENVIIEYQKKTDRVEPPRIVSVPKNAEPVDRTNACVVDFHATGDYSYTRPISFSYSEVKVNGVSSWTDLYVKLVSMLYDEYSSVIPTGKSFTGSGRVDFGNSDYAKSMIAPKSVYMQMYLETNLSATNLIDKIRALLDICHVDYEKVIIEYQKKTDSTVVSCVSAGKTGVDSWGKVDAKSFLIFLRDHEGMAESTCRSYISAVGISERFAKEHRFEHRTLFTDDWREAKATVDALFSDPVFIDYNNQQHNRFRAAMKKLLLFLRTDPAAVSTVAPEKATPSAPQTVVDEKYCDVLTQYFQKGFRLGSPLELRKFKRYYEQTFEHALEDDDAQIERCIGVCGIQFEDKVFMPQTMLGDDVREKLFAYIRRSFDEGKTALYYQALFNEFSEDFLDYFIYNADMLKAYLSFILGEEFYFDRSYLSKDASRAADPVDEIRTCLREYDAPMTYDVMFENLPHIPQQKIKQILASNNEFISNGRGEYFHVSAVHFSDEELDNIAEIITAAIDDKEFLSGNELINAIKAKYPYTYEKNDAFSMVGLRDSIKYHLCRKFSFSGNIISKYGSFLTMSDVFADFCRNRDSFSLDELNVLANELGSTIYFDSVYSNSLRINRDRFVSKARAQFNVPDTDAALDRFCTGEYISIRNVDAYSLFPNAGFPWNEYLLEHYVAAYSEKYALLHIGFNANACVGAIVKKNTGYENIDDIVVRILADSDILLKKQAALQYLCDEGYIARRMYTNIEELLIRATAQRNRKEAN